MFSLFGSSPIKKLKNKRKQLLKSAMETQRSGDLKSFAKLMKEVEEIEMEINDLENK